MVSSIPLLLFLKPIRRHKKEELQIQWTQYSVSKIKMMHGQKWGYKLRNTWVTPHDSLLGSNQCVRVKQVLSCSSPGSRWLCCSACWEPWKVLILSPQSDPLRLPLLRWERVEQTSPSGCSKTPWSYWTTWWAERWWSAWTEEERKVSELVKCDNERCCFLICMFYTAHYNMWSK